MSGNRILDEGKDSSTTSFSHTITFDDITAEGYLKELKNIGSDWGRSASHDPNLSSEHSLDLFENKEIVNRVSNSLASNEVAYF